ncbi:tight adherance operon protein [Mixta theicola]|nr:tight adherance operon protein [Mixta theicola]
MRKANNHSGLIALYRSQLKHKEDPQVRLKLAQYYYQTGDYKSSLDYLQPLYNQPDMEIYSLQARNRIALGDYVQALQVTDKMMQRAPKNAEAWNLRGIALALSGRQDEGQQAIKQSRTLFIDDEIALNNLAVIAMMEQRYQEVVGLLLPQYLHGKKQKPLLHNLVLSLVKVGNHRYARDIIASENLSDRPDVLIDALARIAPDAQERG